MATVRIIEMGDNLGTRDDGKIARKKIETLLAQDLSDKIVIDFAGVKMTSHSFIDESIGKLIEEHGLDFIKSKMTLKNGNEFVTLVLRAVIRSRSAKPIKVA